MYQQQGLTKQQQLQEDRYAFPYHYLDLELEHYRLFMHVEYVSRLNAVKDLLKPFQGQSVLDAGCGDGRFCYELRHENLKVVGVDLSERALAFARVFCPEIDFYAQDLASLSFPEQFEVVVLMETLEHLIPEDIPKILQNMAHILQPNGKLIVTVPSTVYPVSPKHYQHFSEASLTTTLQDYFKVVDCIGHSKIKGRNLLTKLFYWRTRRFLSRPEILHRHKQIPNIFNYLDNYYATNLRFGNPNDCSGIIAVCEKV